MLTYLYNLVTDRNKGLLTSILQACLWPLSLVYGIFIKGLIFAQHLRPCRLGCKVISVGNITLGGTGKTSLVEFIARFLKLEGHQVAILSRGYKRHTPNSELRTPNYLNMGDEPYMLMRNLKSIPVVVDANRIRAAEFAIRNYAVDIVILDDGFQQWRLRKDLEIVSIDAVNPFGNHYLIPRGILREPLSSLRRADIFVLTKSNLNSHTEEIKDFLRTINPATPIVETIHKPIGLYRIDRPQEVLAIETLRGKTATLFSGIADPDSFENLVRQIDIRIGLIFRYPDHHHYTDSDLDRMVAQSKERNIDILLTTEKDAVRLGNLGHTIGNMQLLVLRIEIRITQNEQGLYYQLRRLYPA